MVKQNLSHLDEEAEKRYRQKEKRKRKRMGVSGAGVKVLQKIIKGKTKS